MENNSLIHPVCLTRHCDEPARFNYRTAGHPNGDVSASYCAQHIHAWSIWTESPVPYSVTITGPFGGSK